MLIEVLRRAHDSGQIADAADPYRRDLLAFSQRQQATAPPEVLSALHGILGQWDRVAQQFSDGTLLIVGSEIVYLTISSLVKWLLARTRVVGPEQPVHDLTRFLDNDYIDGEETLVVIGLRMRSPLRLGNVICTSIPQYYEYNSLQLVTIHNALCSGYISEGGPLMPMWAFTCQSRHRKFSFRPPSSLPATHPLFESKLPELENARRFLAIIESCACPVPLGSWWQADESVPCARLTTGRVSPPYDTTLPQNLAFLVEGDREFVERSYNSFSGLPSPALQRLALVLNRIIDSRRISSPQDQAVELGIAAEYFFLYDLKEKNPSRADIKYRLSLRAAWLLGTESADRRETIFKQFSDLYQCRSDIVHMGTLSDSRQARIRQIVDDGQKLMNMAIRKIIEGGGFPLWDTLVFGPSIRMTGQSDPS